VQPQPVPPAVERRVRLVVARLRRHRGERVGGHVGRVRRDDVDPAGEARGERRPQVAGVDLRARQVGAGVREGDGVDVGGVHLEARSDLRAHGGRDGADAAAQVHEHAARPSAQRRHRLAHDDGRPPPGHERARAHGEPHPAEVDPAQDVLEGLARGPPRHEPRQVGVVVGSGEEQGGLLLGEDAPRRPERGRHMAEGRRVSALHHGTVTNDQRFFTHSRPGGPTLPGWDRRGRRRGAPVTSPMEGAR